MKKVEPSGWEDWKKIYDWEGIEAINIEKLKQQVEIIKIQNQYANPYLNQPLKAPPPETDPNTLPAYNTPISVLKDAWRARWGTGWVTRKNIVDEEHGFWLNVCCRFEARGLLESSPKGEWVRLLEDGE